ncbi:MAG TPA: hypothetical protein VGF28_21650 [Thermoanaerobaculia bacterium]|jgi:hypothetical protein
MNEREIEVPQQEEVSIRTGIKAGDDESPVLGSGGGTGQSGSGGRTQLGSGA